jgi:excisionase family DNA binding protein
MIQTSELTKREKTLKMRSMTQNEKIYTVEEIAEKLRVSRPTVLNLLNNGEIKGFRVGVQWRVLAEDLEAFLRPKQEQESA